MAAGLGYIEFTTGDVLTAASANGYLASQVVMVFASSAARSSAITSPQEGMFSYLKDTNATEYYTGSAWAAVGGGGGGGKIAQVVQGVKTDTSTTTSQSYIASGITVSITPTIATSKVLIMSTISISGAATSTQPLFKLRRNNTTDLLVGDAAGSRTQATGQTVSSNSNFGTQGNVVYLDSPATTSATTYEIYWRAAEANTVVLNRTVTDNNGSDYGARFASSIIAMEVLA